MQNTDRKDVYSRITGQIVGCHVGVSYEHN